MFNFPKLTQNLDIFYSYKNLTTIGDLVVTPLTDDGFMLTTVNRTVVSSNRNLDLLVLGLTHGNEVAGLAIINEILRLITLGVMQPQINIGFILGNSSAAKLGKRFIGSDLNRSFALSNHVTEEETTARTLENIFHNTTFLIDLHQTQGASLTSFFISMFDPDSFRVYRNIFPNGKVVTYEKPSFVKQGMTTVNYHLLQGGMGFGIELGEKGFDPYQIEYGVVAILKLCKLLELFGSTRKWPELRNDYAEHVYTFAQILKSKTGIYSLFSGWQNFSNVTVGQRLGSCDGAELCSNTEGYLLFPKYPDNGGTSTPDAKDADICRILKTIERSTLVSWLGETK